MLTTKQKSDALLVAYQLMCGALLDEFYRGIDATEKWFKSTAIYELLEMLDDDSYSAEEILEIEKALLCYSDGVKIKRAPAIGQLPQESCDISIKLTDKVSTSGNVCNDFEIYVQ